MPIVIACPKCSARLTLGDDRAGTEIECPKCDYRLCIPVLAAAPARPTSAPLPVQHGASGSTRQSRQLALLGVVVGLLLLGVVRSRFTHRAEDRPPLQVVSPKAILADPPRTSDEKGTHESTPNQESWPTTTGTAATAFDADDLDKTADWLADGYATLSEVPAGNAFAFEQKYKAWAASTRAKVVGRKVEWRVNVRQVDKGGRIWIAPVVRKMQLKDRQVGSRVGKQEIGVSITFTINPSHPAFLPSDPAMLTTLKAGDRVILAGTIREVSLPREASENQPFNIVFDESVRVEPDR